MGVTILSDATGYSKFLFFFRRTYFCAVTNNSSNANKCSVCSGKIHSKGLKSLSELCSELAGNAVTGSFLEREVIGLNLGPAKSDTVLPTACHRCNISSKRAELLERNDAKMGPESRYTLRCKAAFTRATFSCENRHFVFFLSQIA